MNTSKQTTTRPNAPSLGDLMSALHLNPDKFKVNADAIGRGLYGLLTEDEVGIVAFGMAPEHLMRIAEKEIRAKIGNIAADHFDAPGLAKGFANAVRQSAINGIMKDVYLGLLAEAKDAGKLVV